MKRLRKSIRNNFGFSKTETNGVLILIPLMVLFLSAPSLYTRIFSSGYENYDTDKALLDSILQVWNESALPRDSISPSPLNLETVINLQPFDPNTANTELMESVGIPRYLARRILNYRSSGGRFKIKSDLGKIYDFPDSLLNTLKPFISLPEKLRAAKSVSEQKTNVKQPLNETVQVKEESGPNERLVLIKIDINQADTTLLKTLRGIGPVYAARIVKYRELLGGYTQVSQLSEVFGLSDSLVVSFEQRLLVEQAFRPVRININIATFKELNAHPYISFDQTKDILNTKSKSGKFESAADLSRVKSLSKSDRERLAPYLSY